MYNIFLIKSNIRRVDVYTVPLFHSCWVEVKQTFGEDRASWWCDWSKSKFLWLDVIQSILKKGKVKGLTVPRSCIIIMMRKLLFCIGICGIEFRIRCVLWNYYFSFLYKKINLRNIVNFNYNARNSNNEKGKYYWRYF